MAALWRWKLGKKVDKCPKINAVSFEDIPKTKNGHGSTSCAIPQVARNKSALELPYKPTRAASTGSISVIVNSQSNAQPRSSCRRPKSSKVIEPIFPMIMEDNILERRLQWLTSTFHENLLSLGPPDLVQTTLVNRYHGKPLNTFFYITGVDTSNEIQPLALLGLLQGKESVYCTTNFLSHIDVRIRRLDSRTFHTIAIDYRRKGKKATKIISMNEDLWEETFLCSMVRALTFNNDVEWKLPGLVESLDTPSSSLCEQFLQVAIDYLPIYNRFGYDSSKYSHISICQNYLIDSVVIMLESAPWLIDFALKTIDLKASSKDSNYSLYQLAKARLLLLSDEKSYELIGLLALLIGELRQGIDRAASIYSSDILVIQGKLLMRQREWDLARDVLCFAVEICADNFEAWHCLTLCYIKLSEWTTALSCINSIPKLPNIDKNKSHYTSSSLFYEYYVAPQWDEFQWKGCKLNSNEYYNIQGLVPSQSKESLDDSIYGRIVMTNSTDEGRIDGVWEHACKNLGPIYGPFSNNSINFVSLTEIDTINNINLLNREYELKEKSYFYSRTYNLIRLILDSMNWDKFLALRTQVFVMENQVDNDLNAIRKLKLQKVCQPWLDRMFLDIYRDLTISQTRHTTQMNCLEWELLGITFLRIANYEEGLSCLQTSLKARFNPISCDKVLSLFLQDTEDIYDFNLNSILKLLVQSISYECRFYNFMQFKNLRVLAKLLNNWSKEIVLNKIISYTPDDTTAFIELMRKKIEWLNESDSA